jgi:hypothetical protein
LRCIYVSYGDVSKIQLKPSAKPLDALLQTGFDLYVEVAPKQWMRAVDLPSNHPANVNLQAGAYKAGLMDANGQTFTILNAYNPEHKKLAAQEGLYIDVPYTQQKHEQLEQNIQKVLDELEQQIEFKELKALADNIEKRLKRLQKTEKTKEKQPMWDGVVNDTLSLADALEKAVELTPDTGYERLAFKQAVEKAKKEVALETAVQESVLLNPELLKDLRRRLLED